MPEPTATSWVAGFQVATDLWPVLKWPQVAAFGWPPRISYPSLAPMGYYATTS